MTKYRKILDNPEYQELILKRIKEYGKEAGCWEGICKKQTYYSYKNINLDFVDQVKRAKDEFKKLTWETNPELKEMAIEALRKGIEGYKQTWKKSRFVRVNDEWIEVERTISQTQHNPSQWCVMTMLGQVTESGSDNEIIVRFEDDVEDN